MFKYIAAGAALVAGGAFLGYRYAMNSVKDQLEKQNEHNKEVVEGLCNIIDILKEPTPVKKVEKDPGQKKGVLDIFDKD